MSEKKCLCLSDAARRVVELEAEIARLRDVIARIARYPKRSNAPAQDARDMQSIARQALGKTQEGEA